MNNILFQIGRYFIDDGHKVKFFLLEEHDHFLPQADTFEPIQNYDITELGWNLKTFVEVKAEAIRKLFSEFDFFIGTDLAPAYFFKAGLKLDIYFPHGSDLYEYPFFRYKNHPPQLWEVFGNIISRAQFFGIREALKVSLDASDEVYEKPYYEIRTKSQDRITAPPFLYFKQYTEDYPKKSTAYQYLSEIRSKYNFIVFQQISQDWSMRGPFKIDKGNNHLIKGFADYLHSSPEFKNDSLLMLMEYGGDVEKSKQLIADLGITENVMWLKKMNRKDLMTVIYFSDVCVGELGYREWYSYSSIMEFMAMKKPLIHHRDDASYKGKGVELYPMVDAKSADKVTATFIDYRANKEKYLEMGADAKEWILKDTEKRLNVYRKALMEKQQKNEISFSLFKKAIYFLNPHIIYNYFFLKLYRLKALTKKQDAK